MTVPLTGLMMILCYGHDLENVPLPRWKADIISWTVCIPINKVLRTSGIVANTKRLTFDDVDYKYYLGENYKDLYVPPPSGIVPSYFPNH